MEGVVTDWVSKFKEPTPKPAKRPFEFTRMPGLRRDEYKLPRPASNPPREAAPEYSGGTAVDKSLNLAEIRLMYARSKRTQDLGVKAYYAKHGTISNAFVRDRHERNPEYQSGSEVLRPTSVVPEKDVNGANRYSITFAADRANHVRTVRIERRSTQQATGYAAALALASRLQTRGVLVAFRSAVVVGADYLYTITEPLESMGNLAAFELIAAFPAIKAFFIRTFEELAHNKLGYQDLGFTSCGYMRDTAGYNFRLMYPQNIVSDEHADANGWKAALHSEYERLRPPQNRGAMFSFNTKTSPVAGPAPWSGAWSPVAQFGNLRGVAGELDQILKELR